MTMELKELIISLCGIMSISGRERQGAAELDALIGDVFDEHRVDAVGNHLFIKRCGRPGAPKLLIDTHFDEIGMMITGIKEGGFVSVTNLGGVDARVLPSAEVILYGEEPVYGVFAAKAPHLTPPSEWGKQPALDSLLIDTGYDKEELEKICPIGTPVGFKPVFRELANGRLAGKAFDDKACGACAVAAIDRVSKADLAADIYFLFSSHEETGMVGARTGAFGIRPDYALVIDVTHAAIPEVKDRYMPPCGSGVAVAISPVTNRRLSEMTRALCKDGGIPFTIEVCPGGTGTNANALNNNVDGIPTALCSLPIKSMHTSVEVLALEDAEAVAQLVEAFIKSKEIAEVFGNEA